MAEPVKSAAPWRRRMKFPFDTLTRDIQRDPPPHPAHHCRRPLERATSPKPYLKKNPKNNLQKSVIFPKMSSQRVPKGAQKSPEIVPSAPRDPFREDFLQRTRKRRPSDSPRELSMCFPYSKYYGFCTFHNVHGNRLLDRFGTPFGTLFRPLGTITAPRGQNRDLPQKS